MKLRYLSAALLSLALATPSVAQEESPLRIFIRGGVKTHNPVDNGMHDYPAFLADWAKILQARGAKVDAAFHFPTEQELAETDVLLIYKGDGGMCSPAERSLLTSFLKRGGGLVILHDGMCSDDPGWFATLAGAAKQHGERNYSPGQLKVHVVDTDHPITKGVGDFEIDDEAFFLLRTTPEMHILMEAPLPANGDVYPQAWVYEKTIPGGEPYRSFVWMQGHYPRNFQQEELRDLILRGIAWAGQRPVDALLTVIPVRPPRFRPPATGGS